MSLALKLVIDATDDKEDIDERPEYENGFFVTLYCVAGAAAVSETEILLYAVIIGSKNVVSTVVWPVGRRPSWKIFNVLLDENRRRW
jgi:hypothetical protein